MTDVKRPFLLQLSSSQGELCKRNRPPKESQAQRKSLNSIDRSSVCSSESSSSSSSTTTTNSSTSSNGSEVSSPSLILPYLYVGDQAQTQIDTISSLNISYILSLQSLPKFLSGSPQSTPPPSPTTPSSPIQGERLVSSRNVPVIHAAPNLTTKNPVPQLKLSNSSASLESKFDIIDGADGGLLPSANSSKDYVVEIKHLPSEEDAASQAQEIDEQTATDEVDEMQHMDLDEDSSIQRAISQQYRRDTVDSNIHTSPAILSDDGSNMSLEEPIAEDSSQAVLSERDSQANTYTSKDLAQQDYPSAATASSCSLKQRCDQLSSSVRRLIKGKCINISDTFETLLDKFFDETHSFIEEARRNKCNVLVHCKAGISRSPTIAIAYLMKWKRLHLQDAYEFVKRCRPQISPNLNFMGQLVSYERQLQRDRSHLPSPTSGCLPSPSMPSSQHSHQRQQHQQQSDSSELSSSTSGQRAWDKAKAKNDTPGETRKIHVVSRRFNQNTIDSNSYDSNDKRARVRCFFRRRRRD